MLKLGLLSYFHYPGFRTWLKTCTILVTVSFILPYVTWAFDAGNYALYQPNFLRIAHLGKALTVPEKMGAINQGFQGKGRTVVCIQDLHCNYEVQKNIAGIIQHLVKKHGLKLVGEEGAFHTVDTSPISAFPIRKVREEVSDYFVKQGKITGAEHYSAISGGSIQLEGIETPELYQASRQAVRSFLNAESQGYCYDLRDILDELKAKVYNSLLIKFDRKRTAYREGYMDILKYSAYLRHTARRLKLDLSAYSNLERFLSLKQNFFSSQVDPDQLFKELDKLDTDIRQHLYTSDTQQELDELYTRLDIIEKLLNISVSQEELQAFRTQREKYTIREFVNFINNVGANGGSPLRPDPEMHVLDEYLKQVDDFYRLADERSLHFVDNLVRKMDRFNEKLAVMINGGFHTDKVLAELKRRNITYVSIRPRLTRQDVVNPYFSLLQDRKTPLEKLLAKNQTIMAIWTKFKNTSFLTESEILFKAWAEILRLSKKQMHSYEQKNQLVDVTSIKTKTLQASLRALKRVITLWVSVRATGQRLVVLVAPNRLLTNRTKEVDRAIDTKSIGHKVFKTYESLAEVTAAIKKLKKSRRFFLMSFNKEMVISIGRRVVDCLYPLYWNFLESPYSLVKWIVSPQEGKKDKPLEAGKIKFLGDIADRIFALSPTSNTPVEKIRKISSCRDSIKILQRTQSDPEKIEIFELVLKFRMEIIHGPFDSLAEDFLEKFDASLKQVDDPNFVSAAKQFDDLVKSQLTTQSSPEKSSADIEKKDDVPSKNIMDAIGYLADNGYLRTSSQGKPLFTFKLGKKIIEKAEAKAEVLRRGEKPKVTVNINDIEYLLEFTSHNRIESIEVAGQKIEFGEDEDQYNFSRLQKPAKIDFDKAVDFLCSNGYVEISQDQKIFATEKLNEEVKLQINTGLSFNTNFQKQEKIILNGISYHFQIKPLGQRIIIKELRIAGKEMALKNVLENQEFAKTVPRASANVKYQPGGISDALRHVWNFGRKLFGKPPLTMGDYEKNADFRENVLVLIFGSALTVLLAVGPPLLGFPGLFTPQEMFNFGFSGGWLVFLASHIGLKTKPQNRIWALILTGVNIFLLQLNVTTPFFTVVFIITFLNHNLLNSLAKIANKLKLAKTKPAAESDIQNQRALVFTKIGEIAKTVLFMPDRIVVFLFKLPSWVRTISPRTWASTAVVIAVGIFAITGNVPGLIMAALLIASVYNFEVGNRLLAYIPRVIRKAISNISSEKYEVDLNIYSSREGDKKVTAGTNLLPKEPVEGMPATKPKIDDVIWDIWDENQKGKFPEGIELTAYPEEYGEFGIYYLIKDIQDKLGYQAKVSPETLPRKINKILNQTIYKKQVVSLERFFVIKIFLKDKFADDGALKRYGNQNGEGLAMLVEEAGKPGSAYAVLDGINIGSLTYLLNSKTKVAGILGIDATQEQLTNWNMPRVDMTWEQFRAIRKILREKLYAGTLKEYGDKGGEGLVTLLSEIESGEGEYAVLRGIHIGHLTGLLNSKTKVAGILGIDAQDELYEQLTNWNMPYISMKWKQFKAIREILKEKLDAGTLHKYGDEGGEGLVTLLSEIESGEGEYAVLRGINITSLTSLLNSKTKVAGILGIDARDEQYEQLTNWNMPSVYMTWEQFKAIRKILKEKLDAGTLHKYGDEGGEGLVTLLGEIESREGEYALLRGINIGHLTSLLNSKTKVAGILGINAQDEQLSNWNMPCVDMTGKQFTVIRKILKEKLDASTLKEYGDKGGEGLVKLFREIESGKGSYAVLRGINISQLTSLLNSKTKVAGILGIDTTHEQLTNWNMPYVQMKWKQFKAMQEILKEKLDTGTFKEYGDKGGEGLVTLLGEIESRKGVYAVLRGIHIGHLTSLLNSKTKVAGILGINAQDEQLSNWNMPSVNMTWEQFEAIQEILKEKLDAGTLHKYGDEGGEGLVTLLGEIESREGAYAVLRDINIGSLTSLLNSKTKVAGILGINAQDEQLSNWNMPCVNMKWEQFKTMQEILKEKLDAGTLKEYGDKGGEGLVKLFGEIESGKGAYAVLRGIHIGHLTGLLNSKTKVAGILGIDTTHEQLRNWNMPYVQMKWKQFEAKYTVGISRAKVPAVGSKGGISDALRHVWNLGRKFFGKPPLSMKDYKKNADFRENVLVLIFGSALTVLLAIGPPLLGFPGLFTPQEMFSFGFSGGWLVFLASHIGLKTKPQNRIWALILTGVNIFLLQLNVATPFFAVVFIITFLNHNLLNSLAKIATKLKLAKTEPAAPSKGGFMSLGLDTSVNDLLSYFHNNPEKQLQGFRSLVLEKAPREEGLRVQFLLGFVIPVIIGDLLGYHLPVDIGVPGGLLGSIGGSITGLWLGVIKYAQAHVTEGDEVKASYYYVEALKLWAPYGILAIIFILVMQTSITNLGVLMFIGMVCASGYLTKYMHAVINYTKLRNLEESILSEIDNEENIVEIVRQVKTSAKDENKLPSIIIEEMLEKDDDNDNGERKQLQAKLAKALLKDGKYKDAHFMAVSAKQAPESLVGIHSNFIKKTNKDRKKLLRTPSTSQEKVEYCGMLTKQLKKNIPIEQAKNMADTLLRLKEPAIRLLEEEEVLDSKQAKLLQKQRWTSDGSEAMQLFESDLPKRLIKLYQSYIDIDQEVPAETISRLVATHLVPVSFIRRLQRTYRLGYSDFELINKVLLEPDIEAEVLRKRSEEEPAGELIAENLKLYNPKKMPVLTWDERMALIETLEIDVKVLSVLVKNNEQKRFAYELKSGNIKDILAKLEPDADFSRLKEGQVLISEGNRMQLRITEISKIDGNTFLRLQPIDFQPGQEFPENGHLFTEIPSTHEEIYLEIMETLLEALKSSSGRTTQSEFLDYFFGLKEMKATKLPLNTVSRYHNPLIRKDKSEQAAVNLPFEPTSITCIDGAAGTAKSTGERETVYQAMLKGWDVLLISEMHSSVDTLLTQLGELPFLRIATRKDKIRQKITKHWIGNRKTGIRLEALKNFDEKFKEFGSIGKILAGTITSMAMLLSDPKNKRKFLQGKKVMVIVEESTLASLPAVIAILSHLKDNGKLVVIGSRKQFSFFGFTAQETRSLKKAGIEPEEIKTYCKNAFDRILEKSYGNFIRLSEVYRSHPLLAWLDEDVFHRGQGRVRPHGWRDYDTDTLKLIDIFDPDEPKYHEKEEEKTEEPLMLDDESDKKMKKFIRSAQKRRDFSMDQITIIVHGEELESLIKKSLIKTFKIKTSDKRDNLPTFIIDKDATDEDTAKQKNTIFIAGKRPVSYKNECSADKDIELVRHYQEQAILKEEEFSLKQITIITPYRAQAKLLREKLQVAFPGIDEEKLPIVSTVRSYEGDENDIVIFDLVRSNEEGIWGIVSSVRLLYVALTRARKSLVVVFDQRTFLKKPGKEAPNHIKQAWAVMKLLVKFYQEKILAFFPNPEDPFTHTKTTLKRADERKISLEKMTGGLGEANGKAKEEEATSAPEETTEPEAEVLEPPELENARTFFSNLPGQEDIAAMLRDELPAKVVDLSEVDEVTDALLQAAPKETASQLLVLHGYTLKHLEDMETLGLTPDNNMRDSCLEAMNKQLAAEVENNIQSVHRMAGAATFYHEAKLEVRFEKPMTLAGITYHGLVLEITDNQIVPKLNKSQDLPRAIEGFIKKGQVEIATSMAPILIQNISEAEQKQWKWVKTTQELLAKAQEGLEAKQRQQEGELAAQKIADRIKEESTAANSDKKQCLQAQSEAKKAVKEADAASKQCATTAVKVEAAAQEVKTARTWKEAEKAAQECEDLFRSLEQEERKVRTAVSKVRALEKNAASYAKTAAEHNKNCQNLVSDTKESAAGDAELAKVGNEALRTSRAATQTAGEAVKTILELVPGIETVVASAAISFSQAQLFQDSKNKRMQEYQIAHDLVVYVEEQSQAAVQAVQKCRDAIEQAKKFIDTAKKKAVPIKKLSVQLAEEMARVREQEPGLGQISLPIGEIENFPSVKKNHKDFGSLMGKASTALKLANEQWEFAQIANTNCQTTLPNIKIDSNRVLTDELVAMAASASTRSRQAVSSVRAEVKTVPELTKKATTIVSATAVAIKKFNTAHAFLNERWQPKQNPERHAACLAVLNSQEFTEWLQISGVTDAGLLPRINTEIQGFLKEQEDLENRSWEGTPSWVDSNYQDIINEYNQMLEAIKQADPEKYTRKQHEDNLLALNKLCDRALVYLHFLDTMAALNLVSEGKIDERHFSDRQLFKKMQELGKQVRKQGILLNQARCHLILFAYMIKLLDAIELKLIAPASAIAKSGFEKGKLSAALESLSEHLEEVFNANNKSEIPALKNTLAKMYGHCLRELRRLSQDLKTEKLSDTYEIKAEVITNMDRITSVVPYDLQMFWEGRVQRNRIAYKQQIDAVIRACKSVFASLMIISPDFDLDRYFEVKEEVGSSSADFELLFPGIDEYLLRKLISPKDMKAIIKRIKKAVKDRVIKIFVREGARKQNEYLMALAKEFGIPHDPRKPSKTVVVIDKMIRGKDSGKIIEKAEKVLSGISDETESDVLTKYLKTGVIGGKSALLRMWTFRQFPDMAPQKYTKLRLVFIEAGWALFLGGVVMAGLWGLSMLGSPLLADWFPIDTIIGQLQSTFKIALILFPVLHLDRVFNWILDRAPPLNRILGPVLRTDTPTPWLNAVIAANISALASISLQAFSPVLGLMIGMLVFIVSHAAVNQYLNIPSGLAEHSKYYQRNISEPQPNESPFEPVIEQTCEDFRDRLFGKYFKIKENVKYGIAPLLRVQTRIKDEEAEKNRKTDVAFDEKFFDTNTEYWIEMPAWAWKMALNNNKGLLPGMGRAFMRIWLGTALWTLVITRKLRFYLMALGFFSRKDMVMKQAVERQRESLRPIEKTVRPLARKNLTIGWDALLRLIEEHTGVPLADRQALEASFSPEAELQARKDRGNTLKKQSQLLQHRSGGALVGWVARQKNTLAAMLAQDTAEAAEAYKLMADHALTAATARRHSLDFLQEYGDELESVSLAAVPKMASTLLKHIKQQGLEVDAGLLAILREMDRPEVKTGDIVTLDKFQVYSLLKSSREWTAKADLQAVDAVNMGKDYFGRQVCVVATSQQIYEYTFADPKGVKTTFYLPTVGTAIGNKKETFEDIVAKVKSGKQPVQRFAGRFLGKSAEPEAKFRGWQQWSLWLGGNSTHKGIARKNPSAYFNMLIIRLEALMPKGTVAPLIRELERRDSDLHRMVMAVLEARDEKTALLAQKQLARNLAAFITNYYKLFKVEYTEKNVDLLAENMLNILAFSSLAELLDPIMVVEKEYATPETYGSLSGILVKMLEKRGIKPGKLSVPFIMLGLYGTRGALHDMIKKHNYEVRKGLEFIRRVIRFYAGSA